MSKRPSFFYLIPSQVHGRLDGESRLQYLKRLVFRGRRQLPSGGVRVIYQHCEFLIKNGYQAFPVHLGNFTVDWFAHSLQELSRIEALRTIGSEDVLICPEIIPGAAQEFLCRQKYAFVQNWALVEGGIGKDKGYEDFGFTGLLCCSHYLEKYMKERSSLPVEVVVNGIDLGLFKPCKDRSKPLSILYLNRRNVADARESIALLDPELRKQATFVELENSYSQEELATFYQQADIFLAIGYPEGFSLPPLEAMACGCAVAGFTGGGGLAHMIHEQTALVAEDGNVKELSQCMERLLRYPELKETIRANGASKASEFALANMERDLLQFATHCTEKAKVQNMTYLYVLHIPLLYRDGKYFMERAAALDLLAHRRLLSNDVELILAAPVLTPQELSGSGGPMDIINDIPVVPLHYVNGLWQGLKNLGGNLRKLIKAIKRSDFVHTGCGGFPYFFSPCFLAFRLALIQKKEVLYVMDCDLVGKLEVDQISRNTNFLKKALWALFAKLSWRLYTGCLRTASLTFLLGEGVVSRYGDYAHNFLQIYQPIVGLEELIPEAELQEKLAALENATAFQICFAGRLAEEKGVEVLLRAVVRLTGKYDFIVNVYGDGEQRHEYEELAKELGLSDVVVFHGNKVWGEVLFGELRKNSIQIVPHLTLEMTRNVFDGMASGCALVVSDTTALQGLITDSDAGVLFKTGDPESLAGSLQEMFTDPHKISKYIRCGTDFVRKNHRDAHVLRRLYFLRKHLPSIFTDKVVKQ